MRPIRESKGIRHDFGLYRTGQDAAAIWLHLSLVGRWWGLEVRWDPKILGSKVMWNLADHAFGWLE